MTYKKKLRSALTSIVFVSVLNLLTACDDKEVSKEILRRMEAHSKHLQTLQADFTLEQRYEQLKESDLFKGRLIYIPPKQKSGMRARVDWMTPVQETLSLVNKQYVLYRPSLKIAYTGTIDKPEISESVNDLLVFINISREKLKSDYDMQYIGREKTGSGTQAFRLKFTPKVAKRYKTVEILADPDGMPVSMKVIMKNGDWKQISFSKIRKNVVVNARDFQIDLPKNVKIIKN